MLTKEELDRYNRQIILSVVRELYSHTTLLLGYVIR